MQTRFRPTIYAIDFGTTNSLLAAACPTGAHPAIALEPTSPDPTILRSVLYFPSSERCLYGSAGVAEYVAGGMQGRLVRSVKKHLASRSLIGTFIEDRPMNLEDLIGIFLGEMRRRANAFFDCDVTRVMLGRPARFSSDPADDRYAQGRLEHAARIAGFTEVHFCPEPIAAAREFRATLSEPRTVLVADLGGGTSDFTVMRMRRGPYDASDVLAIGGVSVAGDALDSAIMRRHVARHFGAEVTYRVPMGSNVLQMPPALVEKICSPADASLLREADARRFLEDVRAWSLGAEDAVRIDQLFVLVEDRLGFQIFEEIERAKRTLSEEPAVEVRFDYPGIKVREPLERAAFERTGQSATDAIMATLDETVARAGLSHADVDIVCCTGGTAFVPAISTALEQRFGEGKLSRFRNFHSVIQGLAEHALSHA